MHRRRQHGSMHAERCKLAGTQPVEAIVSKKTQKAEADKKKAWAAETLQDSEATML